jgi:hypothetical protein
MNIEINIASVLAHSVMLFAKDDWHKDYPSIPWGGPQMCAPDYKPADMAAANREAFFAQLETFPLLREIEAAARMGGKVEVPVYENGKATSRTRTIDFGPVSDIAQTKAISRAVTEIAPEQAQSQLDIAKKFGTEFARQRRTELEAVDPTRYALYENFLKDIGQRPIAEDQIEAPRYEQVGTGDIPRPQDVGEAQRIRSNLERQISAGLAQAGTADPALIRAAEQAVRARGTSTGSAFSNIQAFREARAVSEAIANADMQRRAQAMSLLQSGQTTSDVANRQAQESFQNILAATGQRNTAQQQTFAGQMASQQQRQGTQQQNIANIQSALGLQPIVSQAAQLPGLQQGASPFAPPQLIQGMQQAGPGQLAQLGTSFALQNAQNAFQASQAGSPLAVFGALTQGIGNLGTAYRGFNSPYGG